LTQQRIVEHEPAGSSNVARRFDARRWLLIFLGFNAIAAFFIGQTLATRMLRGSQVNVFNAAAAELAYWYIWFPLLPLVFYTARTRRFEPGQRGRAVLSHVMVGLFCGLIHAWLYLRFLGVIDPLPPGTPNPGAFLFYVLTAFWKYFVFIGIYYAFLYYRRSRESQVRAAQLETHLAQARLGALRSQLHPHFLFNTLHAVSMLNFTDVDAANRILTRLGDLLRLTLARSSDQEITLARELEMLRPYCDIEQTRFQDRMEVRFDIDDDALNALVPTLVLQPLVENAIRHGIAKRPEGGTIEIAARVHGGQLQLSVQDDGRGLPADWDPDTDQRVGLSNTRARLRELYGDQQSFELHNRPEGGLRVAIALPLRRGAGQIAEPVEAGA
jgi:two-component system, LytTR family, sensor kinase